MALSPAMSASLAYIFLDENLSVLGITFSLIAIANTKVGIAATLISTMPIIMLPMVKIVYKEKLSWRAITGAVIAVTGVALIFMG